MMNMERKGAYCRHIMSHSYLHNTISLCLCVSGAPPGSRPALQVHHPRVTGPYQGGVPVSAGTVPQVDNTSMHIHMGLSPVVKGTVMANYLFVICPPMQNLNPTTTAIMNETPALASD